VLGPFPILEYLVFLLRRGDLVAFGARREGETLSEIKLEEWATLYICVEPLNSRLAIVSNNAPRPWVETRGKRYFSPAFFEVRIQRAGALRIFPEDAATPPADAPDTPINSAAEPPLGEAIKNLIRAATEANGSEPSQNYAFDIVRDKYPNVSRDDVRAAHKNLYPDLKSGPRRSRKGRAG
jgi:hypothetical protein